MSRPGKRRGSSPRGRGKLLRGHLVVGGRAAHPRVGGENQRKTARAVGCRGLIPAWAGKTPGDTHLHGDGRAHPRVGGENFRGGGDLRFRGRLIPAWAGKTLFLNRTTCYAWAHPRVGGENRTVLSVSDTFPGSSPRGRGKRLTPNRQGNPRRLIPAWAGKTVLLSVEFCVLWAHPRVGGENDSSRESPCHHSGSSPRGRGKPSRDGDFHRMRRLIPAWAGKTRLCWRVSECGWAHPRVGGENVARPWRASRVRGSSPRGRGKPCAGKVDEEAGRLIPAWAGKTSCNYPHYEMSRAHPRVGGENNTGS